MRELRVQSSGKPLRVFYAFDPRRMAILLIGGDKTSDKRFYERMVPPSGHHLDMATKEMLIATAGLKMTRQSLAKLS
jgi:hypothetical protein